jgi:hypothetical protein
MVNNLASPYLFRVIGERILRRMSTNNDRQFLALFGVPPIHAYKLWRMIIDNGNPEKIAPKHLMWALFFLRTYNREEVIATIMGVTEKTLRKWIWLVIKKLSSIDTLVSPSVNRAGWLLSMLLLTMLMTASDTMGKSIYWCTKCQRQVLCQC